jgi:hypothetical protein
MKLQFGASLRLRQCGQDARGPGCCRLVQTGLVGTAIGGRSKWSAPTMKLQFGASLRFKIAALRRQTIRARSR